MRTGDKSDVRRRNESLELPLTREVDRICRDFERAWKTEEQPQLSSFLPADERIRLVTLERLVHLDLEHRLKTDQAVRVESYFKQYPELIAEDDAAVELIAVEYQLRKKAESAVNAGELVDRFPQYKQALQERLVPAVGQPQRRFPIRLNCPHCHNPFVIVDDTDEDDVLCPSCGSSFNLDPDRTVSWSADKLPEIDKFKLLEAVGGGAFGTVYRARDTELDRIVAVKVPRSGSFGSEDDEQRFVREARNAAQLTHPGIVPVYAVGRGKSFPYIVSEFVKGVTLADLLTARRFSARDAAGLVLSLAEALDHAHQQGVVHRDLKPSNIMLASVDSGSTTNSDTGSSSSTGSTVVSDSATSSAQRTERPDHRPRIMDFGLARRDSAEVTMTVEGQILGTPAYMSPEQARGDSHEADGRADIYSLGVILFELLTGERPFRGNARMLLHQVENDDPPSPRKLNGSLDRDVETICLKCLEKTPARRYQTSAGLAADLNSWLTDHPIQARPVSRTEHAWRWCRRNPSKAVLGLALAFTVLTAITLVTNFWLIAEAAREQTEVTLVDSWARSIGTSRGTLGETEADSMWDIAMADDDLRFLFLERVLGTDKGVSRLIRRRELIVQAVVGIAPGRRQRLLRLLNARLRSPDVHPRTKVACALLGVTLRDRAESFAASAIPILLDGIESANTRAEQDDLIRALSLLSTSEHNIDLLTTEIVSVVDHAQSPQKLMLLYPLAGIVIQHGSESRCDEVATAIASSLRRFLKRAAKPDQLMGTIRALTAGIELIGRSNTVDISSLAMDEIRYAIPIYTDEEALSVYARFVAILSDWPEIEKQRQIADEIADEILKRLATHATESKAELTSRLAGLTPCFDQPRCESMFKAILRRLENRQMDFYGNSEITALAVLLSRLATKISSTEAETITEALLQRLADRGLRAPDRDLVSVALIAIAPRIANEEASRFAATANDVIRQAARAGTYELLRMAEIVIVFDEMDSSSDRSHGLLKDTADHVAEAYGQYRSSGDYHAPPILELYLALADHIGPTERQKTTARLAEVLLKRLETPQSPEGVYYASDAFVVLEPFLTPEMRRTVVAAIIIHIRRIADSSIETDDALLQVLAGSFTSLDKHDSIAHQRETAEQLARLIVHRLEVSDFRSEAISEYDSLTAIRLTETLGRLMVFLDPRQASALSIRAVKRILALTLHDTFWNVSRSLDDLVQHVSPAEQQGLVLPILIAIDNCVPQRRKGLFEALNRLTGTFDGDDAFDIARYVTDLATRADGVESSTPIGALANIAGTAQATTFAFDMGSQTPNTAVMEVPGTYRVIQYASRSLVSRDDWGGIMKTVVSGLNTRELVQIMKRPTAVGKVQMVLREELLRRTDQQDEFHDFWGWVEGGAHGYSGLDLRSIPKRGPSLPSSANIAVSMGDAKASTAQLRSKQRAQSVVRAAWKGLFTKDAVFERIQADQTISEPVRQHALNFLETSYGGPTTEELNEVAWEIVSQSSLSRDTYAGALRRIQAAIKLEQNSGTLLNTLGVAQYRVGEYQEALKTLTRSEQFNNSVFGGESPYDIVFLALTLHRLGDTVEAQTRMLQLQNVIEQPRWANDEELLSFVQEAEELIEAGPKPGPKPGAELPQATPPEKRG